MKILVTGGTTFVSRFAAEYFTKEGHDVSVLNRGSRQQMTGVHLIKCDRTQPGTVLSGQYFDLILDITAYSEEHIRALLSSGVSFKDYIFISSSAVYPETNPNPFTEEQPCGHNTVWGDYGANKLRAEQYLMQHVPHAYILRPPYFYGIYDNLYREAFVFDCAILNRPFYIPQDGEMRLQFFHVADLCRFIGILTDLHPDKDVYNVGNHTTVTVKEWVGLCYKAAGKEARFVSVDKTIPQRDYFCFYDYDYYLDVSAQNALMPTVIPLEQGLQEEFKWYKNNPDSIYFRKPYLEYIDKHLSFK